MFSIAAVRTAKDEKIDQSPLICKVADSVQLAKMVLRRIEWEEQHLTVMDGQLEKIPIRENGQITLSALSVLIQYSLLSLLGYHSRMRCFFLLLFCLGVFAQQPQKNSDQPVKNDEDNCCCTTYDTNICLSKVQDKVDQELNQTYQSALKRWNEDPNREELRQAQRAWVSYRDAACKAEADLYKGGTIMPSIEMHCVIRLTRQRIAEIKDTYLFER